MLIIFFFILAPKISATCHQCSKILQHELNHCIDTNLWWKFKQILYNSATPHLTFLASFKPANSVLQRSGNDLKRLNPKPFRYSLDRITCSDVWVARSSPFLWQTPALRLPTPVLNRFANTRAKPLFQLINNGIFHPAQHWPVYLHA